MTTPLFEPGSQDVLVLVDLSAHLFRAYHALGPLSSPSGEPTHAVYGVATMLERLLADLKPRRFAIAVDSGRKTFRNQIYPAYKANRPPPPEDLVVQLERADQLVRAFTPHVWKCPGYEADDVIATAVRRAREASLRVLVVGADKDLMQLVSEDVRLWDTLRDRVFGPPEVFEKFGVRVDQLGDYLALSGDASDNIPGVPSVGPKTAAQLLSEFGTLDGIYASLPRINRKKLRETLAEHEAEARLSRRLVTLADDCDPGIDPSRTLWEGRDVASLRELYETLGFRRLVTSLQALSDPASSPDRVASTAVPSTTEELGTRADLLRWLEATSPGARVALGLVRQDPESIDESAAGVTLSVQPGRSVLVRFDSANQADPLNAVEALGWIERWLRDADATLVTHGAKQCWLGLLATAPEVAPKLGFDTELASYLIDPTDRHDLSRVSARFLGGSGSDTALSPSPQDAGTRAAQQTAGLLELAARLSDRLAAEGLERLLVDVELPLARVLARLQRQGVLVDTRHLDELDVQLGGEMQLVERRAHEAAGQGFNVGSPRQLETILFDQLGLKPLKRTKTSRSTDAATLEALTELHPLPGLVLSHRQLAKLKGTYVEALPRLVHPRTGRVHTTWQQTVTATGRLSSSDPNLQNIPVRSALGRSIRQAFVAPEGMCLLSADYSQIELRILAHLSQDARLVEAFSKGQDVHLHTAMTLFDVAESQVTPEMRRRAKAVNFGVIYGQTEIGLANALGIPRTEASDFILAYYRRYDGVRSYMNAVLEEARQGQAVRSMLGRRRLFTDLGSSNRGLRLAAERMAMNMPIQSTAADLLKLAMIHLEVPPTPGSRMVLTVHDELLFEVPLQELELARTRVKETMESVWSLSVPLVVDVHHAKSWAEAH